MDKKEIGQRLAEAPEGLEVPDRWRDLAEPWRLRLAEAVELVKRAADWPARREDPTEWRADRAPLNRLAHGLVKRHVLWSVRMEVDPVWFDIKEVSRTPADPERLPEIGTMDVRELMSSLYVEADRLSLIAFVGRHRLKRKQWGGPAWLFGEDHRIIGELVERFEEEVAAAIMRSTEEIAGSPIDEDEMVWDDA